MAGVNRTLTVKPWPGFSVTGKLGPVTEKPVPLIFTELISSGKLPVDARTTGSVTVLPTGTFPKATEVWLVLRIQVAPSNFRGKTSATPPALAVMIAAVGVCGQ